VARNQRKGPGRNSRYTAPSSPKTEQFIIQAQRAGPDDLAARIPDLGELRTKSVAVLGLGGLGAPIALDLARAQIGGLKIVDYDTVDPATAVRWPFGLAAANQLKVDVLGEFIAQNYPFTSVQPANAKLGGVRFDDTGMSEPQLWNDLLEDTDLIVSATAETGVNDAIAEIAREHHVPFTAVWATAGVWGGVAVRVLPDADGCWQCVRHAIAEHGIPEANADPNGNLQPHGCADPTFTGTGFDLSAVANIGTRLAVATLAPNYGHVEWDIAIIELRDQGTVTGPKLTYTAPLSRHPSCATCT
jgi:molybdopterin/thiamine biosynthesis adenylyltransferase